MDPLASGIPSSLRVYGEDDLGPYVGYDGQGQFVYPNYWDPFDPTALQKDVLTFNPAIWLDEDFGFAMSADSHNIHTKKYLRLWYEPCAEWSKPVYEYPAIQVETTYMLVDEQDWIPTTGSAGNTWFIFPIAEIPLGQTGLGAIENVEGDPYKEDVVTLASVAGWVDTAFNKTTNGTIRLQKTYDLMPGETVQFLDHKLRYEYVVTRDGKKYAKVTMWYAGNIEDDTQVKLLLGQYDDGSPDDPTDLTWFKRHNERFSAPDHDNYVTWYAKFESYEDTTFEATITVGKELAAGDTFYVNAVRYDVPAVEVIDTDGLEGADEFKYITLRTPLPKASRSYLVPDDGKASSQWIDTIAPNEIIPLNPPFNDVHNIVDDINVVLWEPASTPAGAVWPYGIEGGELGEEYWPWAERYLTMQEEQIVNETWCWNDGPVGENWLSFWGGAANMKIDKDGDGVWIAYDPSERVVYDQPALKFCYIAESVEPEFDTTLLEILKEDFGEYEPPTEGWLMYDIHTLPDHYTEFALPAMNDTPTPPLTKTGDYLLTTSYLAPNSINKSELINRVYGIPRVSFAYDIENEEDVLGTGKDMGDAKDIYVNYLDDKTTIRIYGEDDYGPIRGYEERGTYTYKNYWEPFTPETIRKDSITFNPAIVPWTPGQWEMSANSKNIDLKKFLRIWYEPDHVYSKSEEWGDLETYKRPTIEVETTYMLIDEQDKIPRSGSAWQTFFVFPIAEDTTTEQPGLELFENPNSDPDRPNVVTLAYVNGTVEPYNKTVFNNATIRIQKTYTLVKDGEPVQFLDHSLQLKERAEINDTQYAKVKVTYEGNPAPELGADVVLGEFDDEAKDPHQLTWFKRHSETFEDPDHPEVKWYARFENWFPGVTPTTAEITVGMELTAGDVFYVDGVRYDVAAIEVIDTNNDTYADQFKFITLRTPFPKELFEDTPQLVDEKGIISSQWIWTIPPEFPIPLNPPFNMDHLIVDDIDVCPSTYPDVEDRIIGPYAPLVFYWVDEAIEPRYSTNLLEVLAETLYLDEPPEEYWTKYDVVTRPDQYTEFVLPADHARFDYDTLEWEEPLHNDYLVTTSFLAPNSIGSSDIVDPFWNIPRMAFRYDAIEKTGKYINEILEEPPHPENFAPNVSASATPPDPVPGCELVEVCADGTTDDQPDPFDVWVDWDDGTISATQQMSNGDTGVCFTHRYMEAGAYTITVYAEDIYGDVGTKTVAKNIDEDCACLTFRPGWNAFSTPVDGGVSGSDLFGTTLWWDGQVYKYEAGAWALEGGNLDPTRGYFVYRGAFGTEEICFAGTSATFDDSWMVSGWNLLGVGSTPQNDRPYWAYRWDSVSWSYIPTNDLVPGFGYFVKLP